MQISEQGAATLRLLNRYGDFMDGIKTVVDMGAGIGAESLWWATNRDSDNRLRDIKVTAYELYSNPQVSAQHENIHWRIRDFVDTQLEEASQDFIWANNSFQYAYNPIETLIHWNKILRQDGMLCMHIPVNNSLYYNQDRIVFDNEYTSGCCFNHTLGSLIYMLATAGFDCRQGHFAQDDQWIKAAVYKSDANPQLNSSLYELKDKNLLPTCLDGVIQGKNSFKNSDLRVEWIDRSQYMLDCI
jgi:SAM-dependent methyltransferase